jgi:hypothetical protein
MTAARAHVGRVLPPVRFIRCPAAQSAALRGTAAPALPRITRYGVGQMKRFLKDNALVLVLMAMFLATWGGQFFTGFASHNDNLKQHGDTPLTLSGYLVSGHFWQATGENWESEFLQMSVFVLLTVWLTQKGSPESNDPNDPPSPDDEFPCRRKNDPKAPWPVRSGNRIIFFLYSHSLSLCFALLFLMSVAIHAGGGVKLYNIEQREHGQAETNIAGYMATSEFWFESFQNWQSEFLSLAAMVWLSVYLRERGSAESKPVATPNEEHGD